MRLTRYRFGTKGPLILAPGYGNAARAFAIDTVPKNWVQYLGEHGYDVWLLDYRASPDLPSSYTQFTVDDIAMRDWPAAVDTVRRETGQDQIQAMGHCVGGLTLFMAIGGGMEGLRSATFSSLAGHPIPTPGNQARAWARLATIFKLLGIKGLNTDYDPKPLGREADRDGDEGRAVPSHLRQPGRAPHLLHLRRRLRLREHQPADDGAGRAVLLRQRQHHVLRAHLADDPRVGAARDAQGRDAYLANLDQFKFPINFITGEHNKMFVPKGLQRTYDTLRRAHGPQDYTHHVIKDYAHLDLWLGTNAERDVWPTALAELEKHN